MHDAALDAAHVVSPPLGRQAVDPPHGAAQHAADDAAGEYSRRDHLVAFEVPEMARPAQEYDLHRLLGVQERETGEGKTVGEH